QRGPGTWEARPCGSGERGLGSHGSRERFRSLRRPGLPLITPANYRAVHTRRPGDRVFPRAIHYRGRISTLRWVADGGDRSHARLREHPYPYDLQSNRLLGHRTSPGLLALLPEEMGRGGAMGRALPGADPDRDSATADVSQDNSPAPMLTTLHSHFIIVTG